MRSTLVAATAVLSMALASPAAAALVVGAPAPDFSVGGAQGAIATTIDLSDLVAKGPVVIYFFPSAFTEGGVPREFAEAIDQFRSAGASVVAMSRDSLDTLVRFSAEECAGKFPVGSADESLVNAFAVNDGAMFNTRTTYVIAPSGKIAFVHDEPDDRDHVRKALAFVSGMKN